LGNSRNQLIEIPLLFSQSQELIWLHIIDSNFSKVFSKTKDKQVLGGRVTGGSIRVGGRVKIHRRETEIGKGSVLELQQQKAKTSEVKEGAECGLLIESKTEIAPGDTLVSFTTITK